MVEMGIFNAFNFYFVQLNNLVLHIRTTFFGLTPCDGRIWEFGLCSPHIYNPAEQEVMARQFHTPSHPGQLKMQI